MDRNALMDAMMGDYMPEVQPGPNSGTQQQLMQKQFPNVDPQQAETMAKLLEKMGHHKAASDLLGNLGAIGLGVGAGISLGGAPALVGGPLAAAGGVAMGASMGHRGQEWESQDELRRRQSQAYPGVYGSQ
jgi:hypothetical protein